MDVIGLIEKKKHGEALSEAEIREFITEYTAEQVPDYQASALLMAIWFRGMTDEEIAVLTDAMARSGDQMDLSRFGELSVDKHSTGGVGDKTTLIVAPLVASLGCKVTKMSGRGLGHTGGTVDKLESIPGFSTTLSAEDFMAQVERVGVAVIGQSGNLTPADKSLYALRDVTATVDSIPLITSSIMSKKLAAGSHNIVLDVKVGSGAFMKTEAEAVALAEKMVAIGERCGRRVAALLTDMDKPLGRAVGNALEVQEAVQVLRGESRGDLRQVCLALAATMVELALKLTPKEAESRVAEALDSGAAYQKLLEWIGAQGGDTRYLIEPERFKAAAYTREVRATAGGYIGIMDAQQIGHAAMLLGAGRAAKGDVIDPAAGLVIEKKTGERVEVGELLCVLHTNRPETLDAAETAYMTALTVVSKPPAPHPLVYRIVK